MKLGDAGSRCRGTGERLGGETNDDLRGIGNHSGEDFSRHPLPDVTAFEASIMRGAH